MGGVRLPPEQQQEIDAMETEERDSDLAGLTGSNISLAQRAEAVRRIRAQEEAEQELKEAYCFSRESIGDDECMDVRFPLFPLTGGLEPEQYEAKKEEVDDQDAVGYYKETPVEKMIRESAAKQFEPWKGGLRRALEAGLRKAISKAERKQEIMDALRHYNPESGEKAIQDFAEDLVEKMGEELIEQAVNGSFKDGITLDSLLNFVRDYPLATVAAGVFAGVMGEKFSKGEGSLALQMSILRAKYNFASGEIEVGIRMSFRW
jgi:hypothetical protein